MGLIPQDKIDEIKSVADIVSVIGDYVELKRAGSNYVGLCPFHNEKTPSFSVSPSKGIFHCFGCGVGGDVISFIMQKEGLSYPEAIKFLADKLGILVETNEVNKEKAKELFAASGLGEGTNLKIYTSDNQQRVNVATMMQDQLKDYGIGLSVERLEWGAFVDAVRNKEHDMFIMSWNPSIVDAHYELFQPFHSENKGKEPNVTFFGNEELDNLIKEGISTIDDAKRADIYKRAQELINREYPWLYICYGETLVAGSNKVEGLDLLPKYPQELKDVKLLEK